MKLSVELEKWRIDRPDEWKMDEFVRNAQKLEAERNELAATVEALCEALYDQLNDCINFDGGKLTDTIMEHSTKILQITPQQHLRDVRAEAARAGYFVGIQDWRYAELKHQNFNIEKSADSYAERVKAGEK